MITDRAEQAIANAQAMEGARTSWDSLWQDLADIIHPRRGLITRRAAENSAPERERIAENFDGTAMRANRTLAHGQASRITPMGARWFALKPPTELETNPAAVSWYQRCGEILAAKLAVSNFYNRAHEHYLDRGAFGIAATEVTSGKGGRGLHFRSLQVGTFSIAHDSQDEVNTLYRCYRLTPGQIIETFGDATPESVRKKHAEPSSKNTPLEILHCITPRLDRDPTKIDALNMPFESLHILREEKAILAESGYHEFPAAVSRWELWGDSPYGWGPGYLALPEATQVNFLEQMLDTLAEVEAFPRVLYPSNIKGDIDFRALGLTCYDPTNGHKPETWMTGGRYDIGKDRADDKKRAIEEAFFVPLFNAVSQLDRDATATEVRAIVHESRELFHPIFANLTREFLGPVLRRAFTLLLRQGELPPPPQSVLLGDDFGAFIAEPAVEYTSAMALALEQSHLANFADAINVLAPLAAIDAGVLDFIDTDHLGPFIFRAKGLPEQIIRTPEVIEQIRQARAQAQQAAAMAEASSAVRNLGGAQGIKDLGDVIDV